MPEPLSAESILNRAALQEKEYDWTGAAESYDAVLKLFPESDCSKRGELREQIGRTSFRAAFQADSAEEFKRRMRLSVESYEHAAELLQNINPGRNLYCGAMARYSDSWLIEDFTRKRASLDDCSRMMKQALEAFDSTEDVIDYCKAFHGLAFCLMDRDVLEGDWHRRKNIAEEAVKYGQNAISKLSKDLGIKEQAWTYTMTSYFQIYWFDFFEERRTELLSTIPSYLEKALSLSEKMEDAYLLCFVYKALGGNSFFIKGDWQAVSKYVEEDLQQGQKSKDHSLIGMAYYIRSFVTNWLATTEEDPDRLKEKHKLAIEFAKESITHSLIVSRPDRLADSYQAIVENNIKLAELETSLDEKRVLLEKAINAGLKGSQYAELSSSEQSIASVSHSLSKATLFLSETEKNADDKKKLLMEALHLREKTIQISDHLNRPDDWDNGVYQNYLALINADLAELEKDNDKKRRLLEEAVQRMEKCIEICKTYMQKDIVPVPRNYAVLGWFHDWFNRVLAQLYSLTKDEKVIDRAIEANESAGELYQKAGMPSRVAEAYWKAARLLDLRGEHTKAAENFELASKNYELVAEKIPQFKHLYTDYAVYMEAWSEIERARNHHEKQEYEAAREHFEKTANMHGLLREWSYLAPNYSAWAQIEKAEELSRKEQSEDSIQMFEQGLKLFNESKESLQIQLIRIENPEEKLMATNMIKATEIRQKYCKARIAVEEAKILDKKGDHYSSSEKYKSAADNFEKISQALDSEQERREFKLIIGLSRAWHKMTLAEAEASPTLYVEASQLFEQTKDFSPNEKTKMLLLGHSRFCRALEAGTKFADTRNTETYSEAIKSLESAANYYIRAGFPKA
ncbi:MAG TPA: hypothetical protein VMT42_00295, partial [candidate division Zixibacteria bacterium]|nr:hypothetical protein [candidate division Zixibacteria bacterium]